MRVIVVVQLENRKIGLRFGVIIEANRILHTHNRYAGEFAVQKSVQPIHNPRMRWANWNLSNHLAVNQFDTVIFTENTGFDHALVVVGGELPACYLYCDMSSLPNEKTN
jgi:hypothetical protein